MTAPINLSAGLFVQLSEIQTHPNLVKILKNIQNINDIVKTFNRPVPNMTKA